MRFAKCLFIFFALFVGVGVGFAQAQEVKLSGTVTSSEDRNPLPGVSVIQKGTTHGTVTDMDGKYALSVPKGAVVIFSFIGMQAYEINTGTTPPSPQNVVLQPLAVGVNEVVVTALGIKREMRALGYATSTIKGQDIVVAGNTVNPLTTLHGKAAGVGIQSTIGGPTGGVNIKIRGAAGLESTANTRPLFVVDGVPIYDTESDMSSRNYDPLNSFDYGSGINDINPEDIESMEILKGAKASVLYGSEGANGVVLITTKSGQNTRGLGVTFSYQHTFEVPHSYIDWQNEYGSGESVNTTAQTTDGNRKIVSSRYSFGPKFDGTPIEFYDGSTQPYQAYPDNFDDLFRTGSSDNVSVAISGGNEKGSMRVSFSNYKYNGIMDNFWQKRNTLSFNGRMEVSDFASFEVVQNLYNIETHNRLGNLQDIVAWGIHRDYDYKRLKSMLYTDDGYFNQELYEDGGLPKSSKTIMDLWWHQEKNSNTDKKVHSITAVKVNLKFFDWLYFVGQAGLDYTNIDYTTQNPIKYIEPSITGGKYSFSRDNFYIQNYEGFLNFEQTFGKWKLHAFAGPSFKKKTDNTIGVSTYKGLIYPGWYAPENTVNWPGKSEGDNVRWHTRGAERMYSVSGAATLSYENTYYLEFQARNDWTSTLPSGNNSYFYPGASFTWNFTDNFEIPNINYGKFRMSLADVGRPANRYFALKTYTIESLPLNSEIMKVKGPDDLFAGDLKPERKREWEVGFNLRMLKQNRLEVDFSYYSNNVYDQIMSVPLSPTVGAEKIRINAGEVKNYGWELFIKYAPVIGHDFKWDVTFTSANQYSKVKKLYPGITRKTMGGSGYSVVAEEGSRQGEIKMFDYLKDDNGNRVVGSDGLYALDESRMTPIGKNVNPDFIGGLSNTFFYKSLSLHVGIDYKYGGSIFSYSNYYLTGLGLTKNTLAYRDEEHGGVAYYVNNQDARVKWEHNQAAPADSKDGIVYHNGMILPGVKVVDGKSEQNDQIASSSSYYQSFMSDMSSAFQRDALYKNNYIKMREVALSYTLPKKWSQHAKIEKVSLQVVARNLFYIYKSLPNVDAESAVGTSGENSYMEKSFYPTPQSFGFGVTVSF